MTDVSNCGDGMEIEGIYCGDGWRIFGDPG